MRLLHSIRVLQRTHVPASLQKAVTFVIKESARCVERESLLVWQNGKGHRMAVLLAPLTVRVAGGMAQDFFGARAAKEAEEVAEEVVPEEAGGVDVEAEAQQPAEA